MSASGLRALSEDGRSIVAETAAGTQAMSVPGLHAMALSSDGALLAAGDENGVAHVFRTDDGALLDTIAGHDVPVRSIGFSHDASMLIVGGEDGDIHGYRLRTHRPDRIDLADSAVSSTSAVVLDVDGGVIVFDPTDDQPTKRAEFVVADAHRIGLTPTEGALRAITPDGHLLEVDIKTGVSRAVVDVTEYLSHVHPGPDNTYVFVGYGVQSSDLSYVPSAVPFVLDMSATHRSMRPSLSTSAKSAPMPKNAVCGSIRFVTSSNVPSPRLRYS